MPALKLLRFDTPDSPEQPVRGRSRTSEIQREYIPGYPQTLFIYRLPASRYWWVRFYIAGKTLRKTTKQTGKREATEFAKLYFEQVTSNYRLAPLATSNSPTFGRANSPGQDGLIINHQCLRAQGVRPLP